MIPLGLVRDTHFSLRVPKYLNVGSLGLTLAHEMLHSLDTTGRQFDHRGRLTSDFWDSRSRKNFANVSECVVKQYQNHFKRPLRIDSRTIMLEVIIKIYSNHSAMYFLIKYMLLSAKNTYTMDIY